MFYKERKARRGTQRAAGNDKRITVRSLYNSKRQKSIIIIAARGGGKNDRARN